MNLLCHLCFGIRAAKRQEVRGRGVGRHKISHAMAIRIAWQNRKFSPSLSEGHTELIYWKIGGKPWGDKRFFYVGI